jgi:hypothetical protein
MPNPLTPGLRTSDLLSADLLSSDLLSSELLAPGVAGGVVAAIGDVVRWLGEHRGDVLLVAGTVVVAGLTVAVCRAVVRDRLADVATWVAVVIATAFSAEGMWEVAREGLGLSVWQAAGLFAADPGPDRPGRAGRAGRERGRPRPPDRRADHDRAPGPPRQDPAPPAHDSAAQTRPRRGRRDGDRGPEPGATGPPHRRPHRTHTCPYRDDERAGHQCRQRDGQRPHREPATRQRPDGMSG